jgi:hypothetical protein
MKIDVPLEIDDVVWIIKDREAYQRIITGVRFYKWDNKIKTVYHVKNYGDQNIDFEYFNSEKDAEIEIARRILEGLKDE